LNGAPITRPAWSRAAWKKGRPATLTSSAAHGPCLAIGIDQESGRSALDARREGRERLMQLGLVPRQLVPALAGDPVVDAVEQQHVLAEQAFGMLRQDRRVAARIAGRVVLNLAPAPPGAGSEHQRRPGSRGDQQQAIRSAQQASPGLILRPPDCLPKSCSRQIVRKEVRSPAMRRHVRRG
jgi:hypothetical protein